MIIIESVGEPGPEVAVVVAINMAVRETDALCWLLDATGFEMASWALAIFAYRRLVTRQVLH